MNKMISGFDWPFGDQDMVDAERGKRMFPQINYPTLKRPTKWMVLGNPGHQIEEDGGLVCGTCSGTGWIAMGWSPWNKHSSNGARPCPDCKGEK